MYKTIISLVIWPFWFLYTVTVLFFIFSLLFLIPQKYFFLVLRPFCWLWCLFGGQYLKKENAPPLYSNKPYIYMFNHTSMFDQFMIGAYVNHYISAVAAVEIFKYPFWGYVCKKYGIIPIMRTKIRQALNSLSIAQDKILSGVSILIAPEGTRTTTGKMGLFKKGPFHLAKKSGATIIPVGLSGGFKAKKKTDWRLRPGILIIKFGKPITKIEYSKMSIEQLSDLVKSRIEKLIIE